VPTSISLQGDHSTFELARVEPARLKQLSCRPDPTIAGPACGTRSGSGYPYHIALLPFLAVAWKL